MGARVRLTMSASRVTNTSVISRGYGEKSELQDLNKILEDSLKEMQDLQESTAEFEKQIAIMEEHAERQVKQRCMKIERHNQTLKTNYRTETNEKDRAQEDALKEEHELELQTLAEEKTLKWRFELNKLDHEIAAAGVRLEAARDRKRQADMDLGGMHQEVEELKRELESLRLQMEQEAADEAYNPNVLDDLIRELEALVARKEQDIKRTNSQIAQLLKQIEKLELELAELKKKSAEARLALAWEQVLLQKALENVKNADARKVAEEEDAADGAGKLSTVIEEKKINIKDLNDSIAELKQLEMDVAGL